MKKNDIVELQIESYAFEGKGVAKIDQSMLNHISNENEKKYIIFVYNSYPGDIVEAKILKLKKSYGEAKTVKVIKAGEGRVNAKCKHFVVCGGCKQQDLDYNYQTKYKQKQVKDVFERIGNLSDFEILPIVKSEEIYHYRNKMDFSFTPQRWLTKEEIESESNLDKDFALGFHVPRVYSKVINIEECFLQSDEATLVLNFTRNYFKNKNIDIYSSKENRGYLRNLVLRQSFAYNEFMVNLVTFNDMEDIMNDYTKNLIANFPFISAVVNNVNTRKDKESYGDFEKYYYGTRTIKDKIGKFTFEISANSFFQTNTLQAEKLYSLVLDFADFKGNEVVYDLYSGASTISIFISENVKEVFGFESVSSAVKDAKKNCSINNIANVKSFEVDLNKSFLPFLEKNRIAEADLIIADPPRAGMNPKTVNDLLKLEPKKIVYVSCNPSTQARDIKLLSEKYKLVKIQPVDMFPQTYHIENVALLTKV